MSATWIGLRSRRGRPDVRVAGADVPVGDRDDHLLAHAVGGAQLELLPRLVEHVDRAGVGARELHRAAARWWSARCSRSSVELTACETSPSACSSPTERARSSVRARNSLSRRTFSMAMTAWLAKFVTSSICLSVNGADLLAVDADGADQFVFLEHRHDHEASGRRRTLAIGALGASIVEHVGDVDRPALVRDMSRERCSLVGTNGSRSSNARRTPAARCECATRRNASPSCSNIEPNFGLANPRRVLQHGLEHRLELAGRAADDLQHLARSRSAAPATRSVRACAARPSAPGRRSIPPAARPCR